MILIYDGSFEGFLTLVYEVYYKKYKPTNIYKLHCDTLSFDESIEIYTDDLKAKKVLNAIKNKFPSKYYQSIFNIFLCDSKNFEKELLEFIIIGFKDTKQLDNINIDSINFIRQLEKEYFSMIHKMYGFVRFEELEDETLYAKVETKFNGLFFLGKHFKKRLSNNNFIIHDIKRELVFVYYNKKSSIENVSSFESPTLSNDEEKFKTLWKTFFNSVTIDERENKKVQRNFVPFLYRTYMSEFD